MEHIKLTEECIHCVVDKFAREYPEGIDVETKLQYIKRVLKSISEADVKSSAPELVEKINLIQRDMFGSGRDYTEIKHHFNTLMLSLESEILKRIKNSKNPLKTAVRYSMMGNYIDFGAMKSVDESKLLNFIERAEDIEIDENEFSRFENEIKNAKSITFLTDNCGEIVFDKLLISTIKDTYPNINFDTIVRGYPVLNDATMDDAVSVGLDKISKVCGNGTAIAGTCLDRISADALDKIESCDLVISKGQGNFETLRYCRKNVYYIFMCKCEMFAKAFGVPLYSGMFLNDLRL